ncbi:glutamate synthase [Gemmatimonadetes bacterium T265]|nr:glutamate synthase [Gemmatimonadetes bacterium T265]
MAINDRRARENAVRPGDRPVDGLIAARHARRADLDDDGPLSPWAPRDACGTGFVARRDGTRSHDALAIGLEALARMAHRGAAGADHAGDGAGVLTQVPTALLRRDVPAIADPAVPFAVGMFFVPGAPAARERARALVERVLARDAIPYLAWRDVPVEPGVLAPSTQASRPAVRQIIVGRPVGPGGQPVDDDTWERALYLARREMELRAAADGIAPFYCASFSCRTVVYKALLSGVRLPAFYPDLVDPAYATAITVFHERYATNTAPRWELVQPFRLLAHNGEINTLWGNRNAFAMRREMLEASVFGERIERLRDVIVPGGSDSASLDNALELLVRAGRSPVHALMTLVPQAWERLPEVEPAIRAFYEYQQCVIEPWDGPAALAYSDGRVVAVSLDRNGLRPCRYKIRADGLVVAGSEVGIADFDPGDVVETGKLGPSGVLVVDTVGQRIVRNLAAKREVAARQPYAQWIARHMVTLPSTAGEPPDVVPHAELRPLQRTFGLGFEELRLVLEPMGATGADAVWSMGDDTPIAPLARVPRPVSAYLRQRFAQVTNPPIDSLRESVVMSLRMHLGRRGSPLEERPHYARMLRVEHPVLLPGEMAALRATPGFPCATLDATWPAAEGPEGLERALDACCRAAERAVQRGARILVVSDRGAGPDRAPVPSLLALGAVRHHLGRKCLRARVGLVVESGDVVDAHQAATLVGYGAEAVYPWLAMASVASIFAEAPDHGRRGADEGERPAPAEAQARMRSALEKGLLKILAKMGISTLSSYCGAQIFEAIGLGAEVVDRCLTGTVSPLGGIGFREVGEDVLGWHAQAFPADGAAGGGAAGDALPDYGRVRYRKESETHAWAPTAAVALQQAVGAGRAARAGAAGDAPPADGAAAAEKRAAAWAGFRDAQDHRRPAYPRDLLRFREPPGGGVPLDDVEPMEEIRRRFIVSAMSLGSLSPEAHATLGEAMNAIGARANSGEGGEDPALWAPGPRGERRDNRIKQVASARFGVTTEYLARADELEIKIVQGAKPGEGGQLPAHKVTALIARLRHAVPGVSLISPPPHHDIYSIEDLAQLVYDLRAVNPRARVGVKLVAQAGVGTVAAGVAKAYADYVLIGGHDGGTGASPLSSIKHAGSPWELGLAEAQQVLVRSGLRHRVELRVDGGFKTGRDVVVGALLGAEAFGFGTAALVAIGCAMARQCHNNTCPTGIATQRDDLRAKYAGRPEHAIAFFTNVAEEVRRLLARLGARTVDEIVGRTDLLERADHPEVPRSAMLDLSLLLTRAERAGESPRRTTSAAAERAARTHGETLDDAILRDAAPALAAGRAFAGRYAIHNHHLAAGARVAGWIAERHGDAGLPAGHLRLDFAGTAGQSFGAFAIAGMHLALEGEANDYLGKGLNGATVAVRPFAGAGYAAAAHRQMILGNTALYGATRGRLFAAGQAGDRFAVRNSGAVAVVEGAGNHCCEYMTGGIVAVLGRTGRNFGAGMSNGVAYVLDETESLAGRVNHDLVLVGALGAEDDEVVRALLAEHLAATGSARARALLDDWAAAGARFRRVEPRDAGAHVAAIRAAYLREAGRRGPAPPPPLTPVPATPVPVAPAPPAVATRRRRSAA